MASLQKEKYDQIRVKGKASKEFIADTHKNQKWLVPYVCLFVVWNDVTLVRGACQTKRVGHAPYSQEIFEN